MGRDTVILSPHFDDAVLSCWHVLASAGEVLVVNVFAGEPPAGALGWWDRLAGASDSATAVRTRIEEDRQALALAGRTAVNLPFLDSQYRHGDQAPWRRSSRLCAESSSLVPGSTRRQVSATTIATIPPCARRHWHSRQRAPTWCSTPTCLTPLWTDGHGGCWAAGPPRVRIRPPSDGRPSSKPPASRSSEWMPRRTACRRRTTPASSSAVLAYSSQIAPLQQVFGSSLEDPQLLGFEVDWRLALIA